MSVFLGPMGGLKTKIGFGFGMTPWVKRLLIANGAVFALVFILFLVMRRRKDDNGKRVLIAGAGDAGKLVVRELFASSCESMRLDGVFGPDAGHRHVREIAQFVSGGVGIWVGRHIDAYGPRRVMTAASLVAGVWTTGAATGAVS